MRSKERQKCPRPPTLLLSSSSPRRALLPPRPPRDGRAASRTSLRAIGECQSWRGERGVFLELEQPRERELARRKRRTILDLNLFSLQNPILSFLALSLLFSLPPQPSHSRWASSCAASNPAFFTEMASGQTPRYLWIGCSDSRVPANQIMNL